MSDTELLKRYKGFISYSQKDKSIALRIHRKLEKFRVPALEAVGDDTSQIRRLGKFFRDDDELGAAPSLGAALEGAIDDAEWLIVICSPNAAQSIWVDREVRRFKERDNKKIFAVIVDGQPNSENIKSECFCPSLRFKLTPAGELSNEKDEPMAPNLNKDGLRRLIVRLASGMLGVEFDSLWQRARRARRLRIFSITMISLSGLLALGIVAASTLKSQHVKQSEALILASQKALASGYHASSLRLATLALRGWFVFDAAPEANSNLLAVAEANRLLLKFEKNPDNKTPPISQILITPDDQYVVGYSPPNDDPYIIGEWGSVLTVWKYENGEFVGAYLLNEDMKKNNTDRELPVILSVELVGNGYTVVAVRSDGCVLSLDLEQLQGIQLFCVGTDFKKSHILSGRNSLLLIDMEGQAKILDLRKKTQSRVNIPDGVSSIWPSQTGNYALAVVGKTIAVYNVERNRVELTTSISADVTAVAFSSNEKFLAIGFRNGSVRLWDLIEFAEVMDFYNVQTDISDANGATAVRSMTFSSNNKRLLTGFEDGKIRYWDIVSNYLIDILSAHTPPKVARISVDNSASFAVSKLDFSEDGRRFISVSAYGGLRIWTAADAELISELKAHVDTSLHDIHDDGGATDATFDSSGYFIISAGNDGALFLWDGMLRARREQRALAFSLPSHGKRVSVVDVSHDGEYLASLDVGGQLRIYKTEDLSNFESYSLGDASLSTLAWSPSTRLLALGSVDGSVALWSVPDFQKMSDFVLDESLKDSSPLVTRYRAAPDKEIAIAMKKMDIMMAHLDGGQIESVRHRPHSVRDLDFSDDGRLLAVAYTSGLVLVFDTITSRMVANLSSANTGNSPVAHSVAISPNGELVSIGSRGKGQVWRVDTQELMFEFSLGHNSKFGTPRSLDFDPSGELLASAHADSAIRIWDVRTGGLVRTMYGHSGAALNAVFSQDGDRLMSSARDDHIRIWDVESGRELIALNNAGFAGGTGFDRTGTKAITGNNNGQLHVWNLSSFAPKRNGINLTEYICHMYHKDYSFIISNPTGSKLSLSNYAELDDNDARYLSNTPVMTGTSVCTRPDFIYEEFTRIKEWIDEYF